MIQGDRESYTSPTLSRLCEMVARIMFQLEASCIQRSLINHQQDKDYEVLRRWRQCTTRKCQGYNRAHHTRDVCRLRFHPDFNKSGSWVGSAAERAIRVWDSSADVALPWEKRADGSAWEGFPEPWATAGSSASHGTSDATSPPKKKDKPKESKDYYGRGGGNNSNDRRGNDGGGRGGGSSRGVHFDDRNKGMLCRTDKGMLCRTDVFTHLSCNCGESDIHSTYRQCLVSPSDSQTYFTALTLFCGTARTELKM